MSCSPALVAALGATQRVVALYFIYPATNDYPAMLADYESSLGQPARRVATDSAGGRLERVTWQDKRTRFELTHFMSRSHAPRLSSEMIDRIAPRARALRLNCTAQGGLARTRFRAR